jgi:hypothetical protein
MLKNPAVSSSAIVDEVEQTGTVVSRTEIQSGQEAK